MKIKVVVFNHNQKDSAEELFRALSDEFDTALFDSGSDSSEVSELSTHKFPNIYWTGCWNKAWQLFPDSDVIWGIGGDCGLKSEAAKYREAIESAQPFGVWSPRIEGQYLPYMHVDEGAVLSVKLIEGVAFALHKDLWTQTGGFDPSNYIGWGHDCIHCFLAREKGMRNLLDGRISLTHPPSNKYDHNLARILQHAVLLKILGEERGKALENAMLVAYQTPEWNVDEQISIAPL